MPEGIKVGTVVNHAMLGEGIITQMSPSATYCVVKYQSPTHPNQFYYRTHWVGNLKKTSA